MRRALIAMVVAGVLISGCGRKRRVHTPPPPTISPTIGSTETGIASWYGYPYHGRAAANGEIYDMEKLTAAHRTLPFDTWVRVYNLDNSKTVDVRVNDRGPFVDGRIIDLSHAAAKDIAMIGPGIARVRLEVIEAPASLTAGEFAVQVGAFRERANAERVRGEMQKRYGSARLVRRDGKPPLWRVLVGSESSQDSAGDLAQRIRKDGGESREAFVVRIDSD